jgi:hypothetical protein
MAVRIESNAEPIPGYRLIERLGGGGFGEVWKAEAPGGLHKAIKFVYGDLFTEDNEEGVRAEQELKALSRVKSVRHPYVLSLERFDIINGQLLIVMELADRNLWDRYRECRAEGLPGIPREELLSYLSESAEALDLMNQEYQLQHLDIKPQNIFLVHNHVKVADFGLVKALEGMVASVTGGVTPVYAAPETFDGWVSRYCDQYSLAIVYQELLTGQRPFNGTSVRQLIMQHLQTAPDLSPLPPGDRDPIARALTKNPEERHPTCRALIDALLKAGPGRVARAPAGASPAPGGPSSGPVTQWIRAHDESQQAPRKTRLAPVTTAAAPEAPGSAAAELAGDGVLFPALVVGLGQCGLGVLRQTYARLTERFGSPEALPHLRFLYVDTDAEAGRLATTGPEASALRRTDVLRAPLYRPSHYLRPAGGRSHIDRWLHPKMLYRIPRQGYSAGMRALGRLAFVDNYRAIALRLFEELRACADPEALAEAARQTGLGLRSNKPRVYVVTSLAGGTGSGMFLDLAYALRALLRKLGHDNPQVIGVLLLPTIDHNPGHTVGVGNAYAALTELNHFSTPGTTFSANYEAPESPVTGPIADTDAPFTRCVLLPQTGPAPPTHSPSGAEGRGSGAGDGPDPCALAGHFLLADLTSPLGRAADMARRDGLFAVGADRLPALSCQAFGLHRIFWPREAVLTEAGRRLCRLLVGRWMGKDGKPVRDKVGEWVRDRWAEHKLDPEHLIAQFQEQFASTEGRGPSGEWQVPGADPFPSPPRRGPKL